MNAQEILKKYGIWIAAGGAALYLVYRYQGGAGAVAPRQSIIPASSVGSATQTGLSAEQLRLEAERLKQETQLEIERQRLEAQLEAERLRQQGQQFNLEQQAAAQRRALSATERGQTFGLIGGIIGGIASIFGRGLPRTPPIITPPTVPQRPPINPGIVSAIPTPNININPPLIPAWPEPVIPPLSVTDWGEPPAFNGIGMSFDSGPTFADQNAGIIESVFGDWGSGGVFIGGGSGESKLPELIGEFEEVDGSPREVSSGY